MLGRSPRRPRGGARQIQLLAGASDPYVGEATFLGQLVGVQGPCVREDPLLHPGQEHDRELQTFGRVERHERHLPGVGVRDLVSVRHQRHSLQETCQGWLFGHLFVVGSHGLQLAEVLHPAGILRVIGVRKHIQVAGALQRLGQDLGRPGAAVGHHSQSGHQVVEGPDLAHGPGGETGDVGGVGTRRVERRSLDRRERGEFRLARVADPPLGDVEDASQADVVVGIRHCPQVREGIADLTTLVEPNGSHHPVGKPNPDHDLFQSAGLCVRAVEDRHIAGGDPRGIAEPIDLGGHETRLVVLVVGHIPHDRVAQGSGTPQPLGGSIGVVRDHRVGGAQDRLGGAVVLLEQDRAGIGVVLPELGDVADRGAPERVDGLVRVADHAQLSGSDVGDRIGSLRPGDRRTTHQLTDEHVLRVVRVLVLVHQHVAEPPSVVRRHLGEQL